MLRAKIRKVLPGWLIDWPSQALIRLLRQPVRLWAQQKAVGIEALIADADDALWQESLTFVSEFSVAANELLAQSKVKQGGAGALEFLYYAVRKLKPDTVFETGVASGWSSAIFLHALELNGSGSLLSSDLPYKNRKGSNESIGIVVPQHLTHRWRLCCEGDRTCIDSLLEHTTQVDVFHYDSDKTVSGRRFVWSKLESRMAEDSLVIFDDIQDNWEFRRLVNQNQVCYLIFEYHGKFVGCIFYGNTYQRFFN